MIIFSVIGHDSEGGLSIQSYDFDLIPTQRYLIPFAAQGIVNYWPSSIIELGDFFAFISIGRNQQQNWPTDTGNVYLGIRSTIQSCHLASTNRFYSIRRWSHASFDDLCRPKELLVGFDKNNEAYLLDVDIDEGSFGLFEIETIGDIPQSSTDGSEPST